MASKVAIPGPKTRSESPLDEFPETTQLVLANQILGGGGRQKPSVGGIQNPRNTDRLLLESTPAVFKSSRARAPGIQPGRRALITDPRLRQTEAGGQELRRRQQRIRQAANLAITSPTTRDQISKVIQLTRGGQIPDIAQSRLPSVSSVAAPSASGSPDLLVSVLDFFGF